MAVTFQFGQRVALYNRKYVRGTRRPGFAGRFRYTFAGYGTLVRRDDPRALAADPATRHMNAEQYAAFAAAHVGLQNATGAVGPDGLTDGNNVVVLENGEVRWVYREQIRQARAAR